MLRGNTVMRGYLKNPGGRTEEAFRGGLVSTPAISRCAIPTAYVEMKGPRQGTSSSAAARNISSLEVEECLFRHPKIMEAAVVAPARRALGRGPSVRS